jgi:hypothetical protein
MLKEMVKYQVIHIFVVSSKIEKNFLSVALRFFSLYYPAVEEDEVSERKWEKIKKI